MKYIALLAVTALLAAAPQSRGGEKIGNAKAPAVAKKAVAASLKKRTASIREDVVTSVNQNDTKTSFTGVVIGDFSGVRGTAEVYTARTASLVRDSQGALVPMEKLSPQDAATPSAYRPPATFLAEIARLAPRAGFGATETVDGVDCKILYLAADPALLKAQLKEIGDRVTRAVRARAAENQRFLAGALFSGNISSMFDLKKTRSAYSVWVGREDLLIRKIEWTFTTEMKPNAIPRFGNTPNAPALQLQGLGVTTDLAFTRWGESHDFQIPREVTAKWGVK